MAPVTRRVGSKMLLLGTIIAGVAWLGCATNGDPAVDEPLPGSPTASPSAKPAPKGNEDQRPAFEAGFDDANNGDPTPDGGDTCVDKDDPGSSENTAKLLAPTNDGQNDPITVNGVLSSAVDVDFYKLEVADQFGSLLQPATQVKTSGVEMCVFVKCPTGDSGVTCNGGGVAKKSDIGTDGCCASGPSGATPTWNCSGVNDSATLYFRIKQTAGQCVPYSFSYAF